MFMAQMVVGDSFRSVYLLPSSSCIKYVQFFVCQSYFNKLLRNKMNRTRSKAGGGTELPCPLLVAPGHATLPGHNMFIDPEIPPASLYQGFHMGFHYPGGINEITGHMIKLSLQSLFPLWKLGSGAEGSNSLTQVDLSSIRPEPEAV